MSGPVNPTDVTSGTGTSAEGHGVAQRDLSGQESAFPSMWWSPSGEQWFADVPGEGLMAFGSLGSREDSLPKDAQRLVPAGPLLTLLPELDQLATEAGRCSEEAEVWVRSCTDRLCARLDSLLPESHAQERTR